MKVQVEIRLVVEVENDEEYEKVLDEVGCYVRLLEGIESVDFGIGEDI